MNSKLQKLLEAFSSKTRSGTASPPKTLIYESPTLPLADVIKLYECDPTCKSSVDLLAASTVGFGFYTTLNDNYEQAAKAKRVIDNFNETVNLDA